MIKLFIVGITGAMGKTILDCAKGYEVVSGYAIHEDDSLKVPVYTKLADVKEDFDVIIDFSNKDCVDAVLEFAKERKKPLVEATTGIEEQVVEKIKAYSKEIPIVFSQNMSVGVNTVATIVEILTSMLPSFDIEIIEKHHHKKVDAPSGTAKMLLEAIQRKRDVTPIYDRSEHTHPRDKNEVGILAVRAGTIVGEHSVIFAGTDEVIEIKHSAGSKKIFANGALEAAKFLIDKTNGLYDMKDVLRKE